MKNKRMKIAFITGGCCILLGIVLACIGMFVLGGRPGFTIDQTGIHDAGYYTEHRVQVMEKTEVEKFDSISLNIDYADVEVIPSDDDCYYLEYRLEGSQKPLYSVENKTLSFGNAESGFFSGFNLTFVGFGTMYEADGVKIYVPQDALLKDISLKTSSGDIEIKDAMKADNILLRSEYGDITTAAITAKNVEMHLSSGDVKLATADFHSLDIESEYGDVSVGTVNDVSDYEMNIETEYGDIEIPGQYNSEEDEEQLYKTSGGTLGIFKVTCSSGDIHITKKN